MNKKCLIVGSGPSKDYVQNKSFSIDIYSIHFPIEGCKAVLSLDITQFYNKEEKALIQKIPLILSPQCCNAETRKELEARNTTFWKPTKMKGNSGAYAIEWCVAQGYTEIYTAGLDFYDDTSEKPYISESLLKSINDYIADLNVKVYKVSEKSLLCCEVKLP